MALEVLRNLHQAPQQINAIGITYQRETTMLWDLMAKNTSGTGLHAYEPWAVNVGYWASISNRPMSATAADKRFTTNLR